jgi:hypothetical protein
LRGLATSCRSAFGSAQTADFSNFSDCFVSGSHPLSRRHPAIRGEVGLMFSLRRSGPARCRRHSRKAFSNACSDTVLCELVAHAEIVERTARTRALCNPVRSSASQRRRSLLGPLPANACKCACPLATTRSRGATDGQHLIDFAHVHPARHLKSDTAVCADR